MGGKDNKIQRSATSAQRVDTLLADIRTLIISARRAAVRSVNTVQVLTSFEIGRRIVEHEQQGAIRAEYGKQVLKELADRLTAEFGRGFSQSNLEYMRKFFLTYRERLPEKSQMPSGKSQTKLRNKSQMPSGELTAVEPFVQAHLAQMPFRLSWSQYVFLLGIKSARERSFYEIEAASNGWTLPELKRQFNAALYERLALSRDKAGVRTLAEAGQQVTSTPRVGAKHSPRGAKNSSTLHPRMLRPYGRHTVLSLDRWQQSCKTSNRSQHVKSIGHTQLLGRQCGKVTITNTSSGMKMSSPTFGNTSSTIHCNGRWTVKIPSYGPSMPRPSRFRRTNHGASDRIRRRRRRPRLAGKPGLAGHAWSGYRSRNACR